MQKRVPIFSTMFSELHRYPRYEVRLDTVDPVPRFISRQWRGQNAETQDAAVRFQGYETFVFFSSIPEVQMTCRFQSISVGWQLSSKFADNNLF